MPTSRLWRPSWNGRVSALLVLLFGLAAPASAATLSGRIVDPDGRPVPAARVVITSSLGTAGERLTDADGRFAIAPLPAGRYDVRVILDGFQADPDPVVLAGGDTRDIVVRLRVSALTESIVVSAGQVDLPLTRAADTVTVITADDLETRQIENVGDALRLVPGLSILRSGGRGAITSLFPRGGGSNYTLVLIDGVHVNSLAPSGYDFGHLSADDVERIEIVRGPESALFGSDAIGAVVQIVTRRGGRPRGSALVEGGNQGTARAAAHAAGSRGAWIWGGGVEQSRSTGYTGVAPATGENVTNDDDHLRHASGTVGWQRAGGAELIVSGNLGRSERGFPGPFGANPIGAFTSVNRVSRGVNHTRQIGARGSHSWSPRIRQRADVTVFDLSSDFASAFGTSASGTRRINARVQEDLALSASIGASAGVEFVRERGSSTFVQGSADQPIPIRRRVVGTFGELRYAGHDRLFVSAGVRVEHLSRDAVEPNFGEFTARPAFPAQTINSVNPKAAVSYLAAGSPGGSSATRLRASAGTGIRPPDAFDIAFTDNPNLQPERSRSFDAGVEQHLASGRLVIGATSFFNRYDDLLVTVGRALRDASRYKTDNISNARARGIELTADARPIRPLAIRVNYTFLDTEILSVDGLARVVPPLGTLVNGDVPRQYAVGDPLVRRPRNQGSVDVTYASGRTSLFAEVTSRGRILDVEPTFGSFGGLFFSPGYAVVNAGATVRIARAVDVYGRVLNLADRAYEDTLGFPALRRSAIIGVRIAAGR